MKAQRNDRTKDPKNERATRRRKDTTKKTCDRKHAHNFLMYKLLQFGDAYMLILDAIPVIYATLERLYMQN